ncbi:hypothetical protein ABZ876_13590 [Streptomyces sp. NPDC046931]|uniref:hypothetical protein n=1 Tax=Streptomyces sp. NPDC046931 TaxID=3154806 RepID=UPI0034067D04
MATGRPQTGDAVILVPGIMGSELVDTTTGRTLWGLSDPRWYVSAWPSGTSLSALRLTPEERSGRYGRVRATRLIRFPAFAPVLAGRSPYEQLRKGLRAVVWHPAAVAEFAYDWRLPVAHNAAPLAEFARRHLDDWRAHPAYAEGRSRLARAEDDTPARLEPARTRLLRALGVDVRRPRAGDPGLEKAGFSVRERLYFKVLDEPLRKSAV